MPVKQEYLVKLDVFEGPLDLLLYLVQRSEVSIADISVAHVARQYLEYLDLMRELNIDLASEYLYMAATLIRLKARELLPPEEQEALDPDEDGIYNKEQLIAQLIEYKKYKEAAGSLKRLEDDQIGSFGRGCAEEIEVVADDGGVYLGSLTVFDLIAAFKVVLARASDRDGNVRSVEIDNVKIDDRIDRVMSIIADGKEVRFEDLFADDMRRLAIVVTFMALLELIKMQQIKFRQEEHFGSIFVAERIASERDTDIAYSDFSPDLVRVSIQSDSQNLTNEMPDDKTGESA